MNNLFEIIYKDSEVPTTLEESSSVMSDKVKSMANGIYNEFEQIIKLFDSSIVKSLMPLVVSALENLDELEKNKRNNDMEIELLREDNYTLMNHYEKEKCNRRCIEEKLVNLEYSFEDERKTIFGKTELLENSLRLLELKNRNGNDNLMRMEEKEKDQKKEYHKLHERYTDLLKCHMDFLEKLKISGHGNVVHFPKNFINKYVKHHDLKSDSKIDFSYKMYSQTDNYDLDLLEQALSTDWTTEKCSDDCEKLNDDQLIENVFSKKKSEVVDNSYNEFTSDDANFENESDSDTNSGFGVSKEIENMIKENQELTETKNALNIVKDDLIKKVDYLTSENDMLRSALESYNNREIDIKSRLSNLEREVKDVRHKNDELKSKLENVEESHDNKRFTRVEMAILLKERNQYKEKLLELQDALKYTEMIRASRQHPDLILEHKVKSPTTLMDLFRGLLKQDEEFQEVNEETKNDIRVLKKRSSKLNIKSQKCFVFKEEPNRSQLYGWSVPRSLMQSSISNNVPIPVSSHSILETKDSIICVTISPDGDSREKFLWVIVERPVRESHAYFIAQFSLTSRHELTPNNISYLKITKRPQYILAAPRTSQIIEDRAIYLQDCSASPTHSPEERPNSTLSDNIKISRVHNTRAKVKIRACDMNGKTLWINYGDGAVVICSVTENNIFDGRLATMSLPGSISIMKYSLGRVFICQTDGCLCVFDLKPSNESWEFCQCLVVEMTHSSPISALDEHVSTDSIWFGSDQQIYIIGVQKLNLINSFYINNIHEEEHLSRVECICISQDLSTMWISMSEIGILLGYDSCSYQLKINLDFRANLFNIIESLDKCLKFRFSFPIITEDDTRLWLGSNCGFIICLPKKQLSECKDVTSVVEHIYVSCHGFSGSLVSVVSLPITNPSASSLASTPNSVQSLSPTCKKRSTFKETLPSIENVITYPLIVALGSSYVNLNSSPSKNSCDDVINNNNVLIWKI